MSLRSLIEAVLTEIGKDVKRLGSDTLVCDSSTTTAAINTFLSVGGYRRLRGTATLTGSLIVPSNIVLDAEGAVVNGSATANLIQNAAAVPARTVSTAAGTAASNQLTAAGANFTAADVGKRVEVVGLGPNAVASAPGSWYGTIISVVNSTTAMLDTPANITGSGATLYVYPARDANIIIHGGTWKPGNKNAISQTQESHGFRIRRADNVFIGRTFLLGPGVRNVGGQYSMSFGDVTRVITRDLQFQDTNSDGIHFQGPAKGIIVDGVMGSNTGDDMVAFTGVDGQSKAGSRLGDTEGDITDVEVHNITGYDVWTHLKITGGTGPGGIYRVVSNFRADGIHGSTATGAPVNIVNYAGITTFDGEIVNVDAIGASPSNSLVICSASNTLHLVVDGVHWPVGNGPATSGVVALSGTIDRALIRNVTYATPQGSATDISSCVRVTASAINVLEIVGTYADDATVQNFCAVEIANGVTMDRMVIENHHSAAITGNVAYFTGTNWSILAMHFIGCYRQAGSLIDGTGTSTTSSDLVATGCVGGSAWFLLRQPANISISGCSQTVRPSGAGIRAYGATASPIVISVAGSSRGSNGLVSRDGSQSIRVAECICIPVSDATVSTAANGDTYSSVEQKSLRLRANGVWKTL